MTEGRILHLTLAKCGSQWVRDVLRAPELIACGAPEYSGITGNLNHTAMPDLPPCTFSGPIYHLDRWEWLARKQAGDRAVVVLRDPRDRIVSAIFSYLYSHGGNERVDARRSVLQSVGTLEQQIRMMIVDFAADARYYRSWATGTDDDALVVRYEDLIRDQYLAFSGILDWLGVNVPENTLRAVVDRLSFENRSGRRRGETDIFSHYRRGVAGDWREHFQREHGELWERLYPGLLAGIGYESDGEWWQSLHETPSAAAPHADEATIARKRIEVLERQLTEKEAEIQSLSRTCAERLDLIERLNGELSRREATQTDVNGASPKPEDVFGPLLAAKEQVIQEQTGALQAHRLLLQRGLGIDLSQQAEEGGRAERSSLSAVLENIETSYLPQLQAKEQVIREQAAALRAYRLVVHKVLGIGLMVRVRDRLRATVRPRLGSLRHHAPRPLRLTHASPAGIDHAAAPSISIVVPSFNQGDFIGRTLSSVVDQGYPRLELRVQDGGSTDRSVEVLESWTERLAGWVSEPDAGQSDAINRAFAQTSGEIMAWLNSDDILLPGALACVAAYFQRHPEVDVVYGNRILIDTDDMEIGRWILPAHDDEILSWADYIPQETLFWRRRIWDSVEGRVDDSFRFAMDWDLLVRFRDAGARFAHLDRFLGAFRIHAQQKTSAAIEGIGYQEMERIRERCLGRIPTHAQIRRAVAPYLLRHLLKHLMHSAVHR